MQNPNFPGRSTRKLQFISSKESQPMLEDKHPTFHKSTLNHDEKMENNFLDQSFISHQSSIASFNSRKSILKVPKKFDSTTTMSVSNISETKKHIKFSKTDVHLVENWKDYNKQKRTCCFGFFFKFN